MRKLTIVMVTVLLLVSCKQNCNLLVLTSKVDVLAHPYPMGYPSSNPMPNSSLDEVGPGEICVYEAREEKDFRVYEIKLNNGKTGYIIHSREMRLLDSEK